VTETAVRTTAREVLDHHVALYERLARPSIEHKLLIATAAAAIRDETDYSPVQFGAQPIPGELRAEMMFRPYGAAVAGNPEVAGQFLEHLARDLFGARTYQVTAEMCDLAEAMMGQVAGQDIPLDEEELPSPWGFCWLDKPYVHPGRKGSEMSTRAFSWGPCRMPRDLMAVDRAGRPSVHEGSGRAVRVTFWHLSGDPELGGMAEFAEGTPFTQAVGPLAWYHTDVLPFGFPLNSTIAEEVHTFWSLMQMEIASTVEHTMDRSARRRAQRSIRHDRVHVVTLRRPAHEEDTGGGHRHVDWKCCWLVRGHRRQAPHGGTFKDGRRSTWVKPYIKGPDDKPLRSADILYRLSK
jgi:hypothetical protein